MKKYHYSHLKEMLHVIPEGRTRKAVVTLLAGGKVNLYEIGRNPMRLQRREPASARTSIKRLAARHEGVEITEDGIVWIPELQREPVVKVHA